MNEIHEKEKCVRACVCVCVCACVCARACARVCVCASFFHTKDDSQTLESAAFVSQLDTVGVRLWYAATAVCDQALVADCGPKSETPPKNMNSAISCFPPQGPQHPPLLRSRIYCVAFGRRVILPRLFDRVLGSV